MALGSARPSLTGEIQGLIRLQDLAEKLPIQGNLHLVWPVFIEETDHDQVLLLDKVLNFLVNLKRIM